MRAYLLFETLSFSLLFFTTGAFTKPLYASRRDQIFNEIKRYEHEGLNDDVLSSPSPSPPQRRKNEMTLAELRDKLLRNPAKYKLIESTVQKKTKGSKRTRKRVANPQQTYLYAAQRRVKSVEDKNSTLIDTQANISRHDKSVLSLAREFGLVPAAQHCDPLVNNVEPVIVGQIRVSDQAGSNSFAYLIDKPAGWSVVGASSWDRPVSRKDSISAVDNGLGNHDRRMKRPEDESGEEEVPECHGLDVQALTTPEELKDDEGEINDRFVRQGNERVAPVETETFDEALHALSRDDSDNTAGNEMQSKETMERLYRIAARRASRHDSASFRETPRPSLVAWLKLLKSLEGSPVRGGNAWTGLAGATSVDDSGLLLLCPKNKVDQLSVVRAEYIAVMGCGGCMAPQSKRARIASQVEGNVTIELLSKVKHARGEDVVRTVRVSVAQQSSCCSSIVNQLQTQFDDGIRGDPEANPFDRRATRRLIHCSRLAVSSHECKENIDRSIEQLPDDVSVFAERRDRVEFLKGSFLGRASLQKDSLTNAYREINGEGDGMPGWTIDRYDKWLLVQHDPSYAKGPIPSLHDGNTAGVYYLTSYKDRSRMRTALNHRPELLEGKPAPDEFSVSENGVRYLVSLGRDLSTGLFLDQRPQRAWLMRNCGSNTRVLNCFAHTGAFSVAAATAGASTVSIDLSKKWLDRFPRHLELNHIKFDRRHDMIHGDCFEWLAKLAKRGEKFDIVILDPPSSSVGGTKKKRWSIRNDMDELVSLAVCLVNDGGLLWTTTNSASIHPIKFAILCDKGFEKAPLYQAQLEHVQPMPVDFPSIGPQPVTNLVWRIKRSPVVT